MVTIYKTKFKMNKAKDTQEGNKLIDVFMGDDGYLGKEYEEHYSDEFWRPTKHIYTPEDLEYHTSWDWLWPVCEKIQEQTGAITLEAIFRKLQERYKKIICNRHQLWEAVIEYITWYNQNKTS